MDNKTNIINCLKECWYKNKTALSTDFLKNNGIVIRKNTKPEIYIGNFRLKKRLLGGYKLTVINNENDLNNKPYLKNTKLIKFLQHSYEQENEIKESEMEKFDFNTGIGEISFGNIVLRENISFGIDQFSEDYYTVDLIDAKKTVHNKLNNEQASNKKVLEVLSDYILTKAKYNKKTTNEELVNIELVVHFQEYFEIVKKGQRSGKTKTEWDMIIGDSNNPSFVFELKLAKKLTGQSHFTAKSQVEAYRKDFNCPFILLVIGNKEQEKEEKIAWLKEEMHNSTHDILFYYHSTK